ncbi:Kinase binding protein CGI-121 family protein [Babesia bovis T2Bo]|uniref:Kinase binding protein CGI-121 family protein n=1 Tax=Babesia bovis T2Bo TaxID=484906 RepID=UPI001DF6CB32|nr:Kinase binding protein CGI-121 family protein [Babesia bovis T2Bo]EDO06836.2 Kinase binding protein CGI-121 family protein [Babesia bovis T2Bo]
MESTASIMEVPIFQADLETEDKPPIDRLYVSMELYKDVTNRNEIVQLSVQINSKWTLLSQDNSKDDTTSRQEEDTQNMLNFDVLHIVIKPEMITSTEHISHAISRAATNAINRKVHSNNFTTEVVYMMGGSSSVTKCMQEICIQQETDNNEAITLMLISISKDKSFGTFNNMIKGTRVDLNKLNEYTNNELIAKAFKCSQKELQLPGGINACVLGRIGTKRI